MKPEPQEVSPQKALAEVSVAVPADIHPNIIIIGSLAAGYHFFGDDQSKAVRTKDVDCVLEPFHAAVGAGQSIARQLLDAGWQLRPAYAREFEAFTPSTSSPWRGSKMRK